MILRDSLAAFRHMLEDPDMPFSNEARKGILQNNGVTHQAAAGMLIGYAYSRIGEDQELWWELKDFEELFGNQALHTLMLVIVREGFELAQLEKTCGKRPEGPKHLPCTRDKGHDGLCDLRYRNRHMRGCGTDRRGCVPGCDNYDPKFDGVTDE